MACESCMPVRPARHTPGYRLIGIVQSLRVQHWLQPCSYAVTAEKTTARRYGKAHVVCACEGPGAAFLGCQTLMLWGKNNKGLYGAAESALERYPETKVVVVALYEGTREKGNQLPKIASLAGDRKSVFVRFADEPLIRTTYLGDLEILKGEPLEV